MITKIAVGGLLTAYVIDKICNSIIAHISSNRQKNVAQLCKFAFLACCLLSAYPYSPFYVSAMATASVAIAVYQANTTPQKKSPEKAVQSFLTFVKSDKQFVFPEDAQTYLQPLKQAKPGQVHVVTGKINIRPQIFALWALQQFSDYKVAYISTKDDLDGKAIDTLLNFLQHSPKTIIFTESKHILHSLTSLPSETYILGLFGADPLSSDTLKLTRIRLGGRTAQVNSNLMIHWLKSDNFKSIHPNVTFEDQMIEKMERVLGLVSEKVNIEYYRDALLEEFASYMKATSDETCFENQEKMLSLFFTYLRQMLKIPPHVLVSVAQTVRQELSIDFSYRLPPTKVTKPSYLVPLIRKTISSTQKRHQEQLRSGLGGVERRHIFVSGCPPLELKQFLQGTISEQETLLEWKVDEMASLIAKSKSGAAQYASLFDYLWAHPKTVLYISSLSQLQHLYYNEANLILDTLPTETRIVCASVPLSQEIEHNLVLKAFLEQSKEVYLAPLSEKESEQAVREWTQNTRYKDIQFEERTIEAAVKMAYLLIEQGSGKLSFIKDLIERTIQALNHSAAPVTITHLWNTFTELYLIEKNRIEKTISQHQLLSSLSPVSDSDRVRSLNAIGLVINAEFKVELPLQAEVLHQPPYFLENLNEKMRDKLRFAVGNERRIVALTQALRGLNKQNALLIGAPGVGKTTLVESIAWMLERGELSQETTLQGKTIYSLDITEMTKGIQYIGTFEGRVSQLISFLRQNKTAILFIDEMHLILGAGVSQGNPMGSLAQKLKPYLTEEWITVIGATTPGEASRWMQGDESAAFLRRFKRVEISQPNDDECQKILLHITQSDKFKDTYPGVTFDETAIQKSIELTNKTSTKVGQPDRSKDLLERAAGEVLSQENKNVTVETIERVFKQVAESAVL